MKHLIKTADSSSLATVNYNRVILNTTTDNVTIDYSYVDLGLPSGLKWATRNVGAEKETDYGDYFMWGSTTPNTASQCNWSNAPFNGGNTSYNADAFNQVKGTVCPNGILAKEYDTATQIMGGDWRMPTRDDLQELLNNTNHVWVTINEVNGWKFTSKTNGNSIFIPAAGYCSNGSEQYVGRYGNVWTSSLDNTNLYMALDLEFDTSDCNVTNNDRCNGQSVRGVRA